MYICIGSILLAVTVDDYGQWILKALFRNSDNCLLTVTGNRADPKYVQENVWQIHSRQTST